jgi:hypothetical protein
VPTLFIVTIAIVAVTGATLVGVGLAIARYMHPLSEGRVIGHRVRKAGYAVQMESDIHGTTFHDVPVRVTGDQRMLIKGTWGRTKWVPAPKGCQDCRVEYKVGTHYVIPTEHRHRK